jgi:uncharacterized protein (TIGR00730 family)
VAGSNPPDVAGLKRVCVFCGSSAGRNPAYAEGAAALAAEMLGRGIGLVYGGGRVGLMGAMADAMLAGGGEVIGVIPEALMAKEIGHAGLTRLEVVGSMHERKARMADLADAFVGLPGGFGTLEELAEALTWTQLGIQDKPCGLLNIETFFQPLLTWFDLAVAEGFIKPEHRSLVISAQKPAIVLDRLADWRPVVIDKWIR